VALVLMLVARPVAVFLCLRRSNSTGARSCSSPGSAARRGRNLPGLDPAAGRLPKAYLYFDVAFVVVLLSLLLQGWTLAFAARRLDMSLPRSDPVPRRVELDLPGQLEQRDGRLSGAANSPYLRRGLIPSWAKPTLVIRKEHILTPAEAEPVRAGRLRLSAGAAGKGAGARPLLHRHAAAAAPDPRLLGDFFVGGTATLGALAEIYGLQVAADHSEVSLADFFTENLGRAARKGDIVQLGPIALLAHARSRKVRQAGKSSG
jgi:cell volume regulation protein A